MPEGFRYPTESPSVAPTATLAQQLAGRPQRTLHAYRHTQAGCSRADAGREVAAIIAELQRQHPDEYENVTATAIPFIDAASTTDFGVMNIVMLAAGTSILLLACLNVGNLLLVRASERTQELTIRSALGGTRARIIRQVMMESMLISLLGGGLGLWLGTYGARFVKYQTEVVVGSTFLPFWMRFDISCDVLLIATGATLVIWLLAGGIPAWRASRVEINTALAGGSKGVAGRGNSRVSTTLVAAESRAFFFPAGAQWCICGHGQHGVGREFRATRREHRLGNGDTGR